MAINRISRLITRIRNRSERGAAAVEFAIGGGLLAVMAFGSAEYGLTLQKSHTLASSVRQASRVASTPCQNSGDCKTGNRPYDDFYVLRAAQAGMGEYWKEVNRVIVYKIVGTSTVKGDGGPPAACLTSPTGLAQPTASPKAVYCNVYTKDTTFTNLAGGATLKLLSNLDKFEDSVTNGDNLPQLKATFGSGNDCGTGLSRFFCPVSPAGATLRPRTLRNPSRVGVYIDVKHSYVTGMFGSGRQLAQWDAFALEPHPDDNSTDLVVNSPTGPVKNQYDLEVSAIGPTSALPGDVISYEVTVRNIGDQKVNAAGMVHFHPSFSAPNPEPLTNVTWTCTAYGTASCPAGGSSTQMGPITLPASGNPDTNKVVYTVTGTVNDLYSGNMVSQFNHVMPGGTSDPTNAPVDVLTSVGRPDLGITKTTSTPSVGPGGTVSYTLLVQNVGKKAKNAVITDTMPTKLANVNWTCTVIQAGANCPATPSGTGNINHTTDIDENAKLQFDVTAIVGPTTPTGDFVNTAQVVTTPTALDIPASALEPSRLPNTASATVTVTPPQLEVDKTAVGTAIAGGTVKWQVKVKNNSAVTLTGIRVEDTVPAPATGVVITCSSSNAVTSACPSGTGLNHPLNTLVTVAPAETLTFQVTGNLAPVPGSWTITNTAKATTPSPWNGPFTDSNTQNITKLDLAVTKSAVPASGANIVAGSTIEYTVRVTSNGAATGVQVTDAIPTANLTINWWKCISDGGAAGASCATYAANSTSASMNPIINFTAAGTVTFKANVTVNAGTAANTVITNNATARLAGDAVAPNAPLNESNNGNNNGSVNHTVRLPKLTVDKTVTDSSVYPGQTGLGYTITVANTAGLGPVNGIRLVDNKPTNLSSWNWSCAVCGVSNQTGNIDRTFNLTDGQTATFTVTAVVSPSAPVGALSNTATASVSVPSTLDTGSVLTKTATTTVNKPDINAGTKNVTPTANVGPGNVLTYTITFTNAGPGPANGVQITDTLNANLTPGTITSCSVTNSGTCGAGSFSGQNLSQTVNMPDGAVATVSFTATIKAGATGTIPNIANAVYGNDATTTNNATPNTPITIVPPTATVDKSNSIGNVGRGAPVWYDIVVTNSGGGIMAASVSDPLPAVLTAVNWKCTGAKCPAGTIGTVTGAMPAQAVSLAAGESVTFRINATVKSTAAMGTFTNTASVVVGGVTKTDAESDTVVGPNIRVSKTVVSDWLSPGQQAQYNIVITNPNGPGDSALATFNDSVPTSITGVVWTCTASSGSACPSLAGNTNTNKTFTVKQGGTVTITARGTVAPSAPSQIDNTATVANPSGLTDPDTTNNSSTVPIWVAQPDLIVTKTASSPTIAPGSVATWTIVAYNDGPGPVTGAKVSDTADSRLTNVSWTCAVDWASTCPASSGTGNLSNALVNLPAWTSATFTFKGTLSASASGTLPNTATIAAPTGITDRNTANNTSTATMTILGPDLQIEKTDNVTLVNAGGALTYKIIVKNAGPAAATGAAITDTMPVQLTGVSWSCVASSGASCGTASGSGNISTTSGALPVNATLTYTVNATVTQTASGTITNTATVTPASGVTDPNTGNNSSTDNNTKVKTVNLKITKSSTAGSYVAGTNIVYVVEAFNEGPINLTGVKIADTIPAPLTNVTWTCAVITGTATGCASGSGNALSTTVNMNANSTIRYTITAKIPVTAAANPALINTATITRPTGYPEDLTTDNTDNESDVIVPAVANTSPNDTGT
jgi:uncharacterized repeat protein (TIGR01451 family)